jgi:cysteinyl-tRNA synthetase
MLQSYMYTACLLVASTSAFSVAPTFVNFATTKVATFPRSSASSSLFGDDFYADYDPSKYENVNQKSDGGYQKERRDGNDGGYQTQRRDSNDGGYQQQRRGGGGGLFEYDRDTSRDSSNVDEGVINDLLKRRSQAKKSRDFDTADAIRDDLLNNYAVGVDDRERSWRTGCSASGSGMRRGGGGGERRGGQRRQQKFGPSGHDYELSPDAGPSTSSLSVDSINGMLAERLQAKMSRNFDVADNIQIDLIDEGVFVHDGMKEWRSDGVPFGDLGGGRGPGMTKGSRNDRNRAYTKSVHSGDVEGSDDEIVDALVMKRFEFKITSEYEKADAIREGLRTKFNVLIDDRLKEWSVGGDFGEEHNKQREMAEKFSNRGYIKSTSSLPLEPEVEDEIQVMIDERVEAKKDRDFNTADDIREELTQQFDVMVNDKMKLWSVGGAFDEIPGFGKERKVWTRRGGGNLSDEDLDKINKLLGDRIKAKKNRDYDTADGIREHLNNAFAVVVDDKANEWRIDTVDYIQGGTAVLPEKDVEHITAKLAERHGYKVSRDYDMADAIRDELREHFNINIDDRNKEWTIDEPAGEEYPIEEKGSVEPALAEEDDTDDANEESTSLSLEDLSSLTVVQLKDKLRENGLAVSGKKDELINRLLAA